MLFYSPKYLKCFPSYLSFGHVHMSFTIENEKENKMSFLDISGTSVCCKPTSCRLYTHLESILSSTYKIGMIHRFLYRCFWIYLDWDKFRFELVKVNGCLQEQRLS